MINSQDIVKQSCFSMGDKCMYGYHGNLNIDNIVSMTIEDETILVKMGTFILFLFEMGS